MQKLAIIGASGHGKVVADIAKKVGYNEIIFFDDDISRSECDGYPVVGRCNEVEGVNCETVVAIGNAMIRQRLQEHLEILGIKIPVLVHPSAVVSEHVTIGAGTVIMAGAVVNPGVRIGKGCIINTCSSVDHDCVIGDYAHISVGSHIAGTVTVGSRTWIGVGATVINNIKITDECMIGAGAVVIRDISNKCTAIGNPAKAR